MGWVGDRITGVVNDAIDTFFLSIFEQLIQALGNYISEIMSIAENVPNYPIVVNGILYAQGLAFALLIAKVAAEAFQTWILYSNGDANADPQGLLINTAKSAAIIGCMPWLTRQIYIFGTSVAQDIAQLGGAGSADVSFYNLFTAVPGLTLIATIGGIGAAILIIGIFIQTFVRAAHLGMLALVGPILAVQVVGGGGMFSLWLKELLVVSVSQAIQIFMLLAGMYALPNIAFGNPFYGALMLLGWLWATVKAPSVLKQMAYSSGIGGAVGGAAQTAGTMVIVRKMMTRGV